jgi:hypothetical protein
MSDLSPEQVLAQLESLGLTPQDNDDLAEITDRINAINEAVLALEHPDLDTTEPATVFWLTEEQA